MSFSGLPSALPEPSGLGSEFLAGDASWRYPPSGAGGDGTVTSVAITAPSEFAVSGSPVTDAGSIDFQFISPVAVAHGGTGMGSFAANSLIQAGLGSSSKFQSIPLSGLSSDVLRGNGTFGTPAYPEAFPRILSNLCSTATSSLTKSRLGYLALGSNALSADGSALRIIAFGQAAASNNPKSFSIEVGGFTVAYMLAGANAKAMQLEALLTRQSGARGVFVGQGVCGSQAMNLCSSIALSFSSSISVNAFSTTAIATGGFTFRGMTVELLRI